MRAVLANPGRVWQPQELVAAAVGQPPYFAPGARGRWHYSNTNYVMLGLVIEQVTHHPLAIEIHQRIIDPLALRHTFFEPADTPDGALMQGYEGRRNLSAGLNMSFAWSVGNITSTTADLARFAEALFGGALLRPEALNTMRTFVGVAGAWGTRDLTYGLGIMQNVLHPAQPALVVGHTGELAGYRSAMWYWPERGVTLVAAINQESANPNELIVKAIDALRTHIPDP